MFVSKARSLLLRRGVERCSCLTCKCYIRLERLPWDKNSSFFLFAITKL
jgi:hypothetical protein